MSTFDPKFDRTSFERKIGTQPTHIVDRQWLYNTPYNSHNDGSKHEADMVAAGYWKRCECGKVYNPKYGHECEKSS